MSTHLSTTPSTNDNSNASTNANATRIAASFFQRFDANDIAGALDLLTDDATYWLAGKSAQMRGVGLRTKPQIAETFHRMTEALTDGLHMRVKHTVTEGDSVALEVESHGLLKNGRAYNNEYHVLMRVRGDKIAEVREYYDTYHVWDTWFRS